MYRRMRRIASEPENLVRSMNERKVSSKTHGTQIVGAVKISAFLDSRKRMHVRFVLSRNTLLVTLFQVADGVVNSFNLCSLDLAELVVGWIWGEKDMFVIAAKQDERLYYDICCFPVDLSRNAWLECFESRGVKTMVMFKKDRPLPLARTCSKYLMLCLSESSERHSSGGSGNALENAGARGVD